MYLVVAMFCAALFYVVTKFAFFSAYEVPEFKMWLGAVETAFGGLIGLVFDQLFGLQPTSSSSRTTTTSPQPVVPPSQDDLAQPE
jgi:hypothetical protein